MVHEVPRYLSEDCPVVRPLPPYPALDGRGLRAHHHRLPPLRLLSGPTTNAVLALVPRRVP